MEIYLKNKENKIIKTFRDVQNWDEKSVTFLNGKFTGKFYCNEDEYFTDIGHTEEIQEEEKIEE